MIRWLQADSDIDIEGLGLAMDPGSRAFPRKDHSGHFFAGQDSATGDVEGEKNPTVRAPTMYQ